MGIDAVYQAAPLDWDLLHRAGQDVQACSQLTLAIHLLRDFERAGSPWPEYENTVEGIEVRELVRRYPGLESRNCELDRRWDILHYLLSESRRRGEFGTDVGTQAIYGGPSINERCEHVSWTPPHDVFNIAAWLERLTPVQLRRLYDPQQMAGQHLYKYHVEDAEAIWPFICADLAGLQRLYSAAAEHEEGILVYMF